jgi:hypothetical protein
MLILIFGVSMQFPAVQKYLDQKSEVDAKIHRVYGQVKTCPGTGKNRWHFCEHLWNVHEASMTCGLCCELYMSSMWTLCDKYVTCFWNGNLYETLVGCNWNACGYT